MPNKEYNQDTDLMTSNMTEKFQEERSTAPPTTAVETTPADNDQDQDQDQDQGLGSQSSDQIENSAVKPPRTVTGFGWVCVIAAILSSIFLFALDNTITANVQPAIVDTFHDVSRLSWISVAYLLGAASINLLWGQIYTRFDAKWTYIACVTVFEAGSALCGASPHMPAFIVGRALCGLFGSGMYVGVMTLISLTTWENERATYFGLVGITWGIGTVLGPIIGGALAQAGAWRWAFYLNLIVGAVAAPVFLFLIPSKDPLPGTSIKFRAAPIDLLGTVLLAGAITSLLMGISFGGVVYDWDSGSIIALFVVAGVLCAIFLAQQLLTIGTTVETRIFPLHFLRAPTLVMQALAVAATATASFTIIFFLPLYYQLVIDLSPVASGVHLLPFVCFMVAVCVLNGILLSSKLGYYMPWFLLSGVFMVVGSACLFIVNQYTSAAKVYGYTIIYGIGVGASIQMPFSVAAAKVRPEEAGLAIGYCTFFQFLGPAVALSIANAVFLNDALRDLLELLPALGKDAVLGALFGLDPALLAGNSQVSRATIANVITTSMHTVYAIPLSSGALVLVLSIFMNRERLNGATVVGGA
ncbi:Putative HC-toxin efflux carrier TOXA [Cytospora mali]|uniref:HC-toxin efflux carrier TOXA n=1 Tax=Cytospora mali TaxID=578113 RepID=A0A194VXR0_CYTMA|nr:Putative HC-toxin efflux carrier TOXA [Valsa mali]